MAKKLSKWFRNNETKAYKYFFFFWKQTPQCNSKRNERIELANTMQIKSRNFCRKRKTEYNRSTDQKHHTKSIKYEKFIMEIYRNIRKNIAFTRISIHKHTHSEFQLIDYKLLVKPKYDEKRNSYVHIHPSQTTQ